MKGPFFCRFQHLFRRSPISINVGGRQKCHKWIVFRRGHTSRRVVTMKTGIQKLIYRNLGDYILQGNCWIWKRCAQETYISRVSLAARIWEMGKGIHTSITMSRLKNGVSRNHVQKTRYPRSQQHEEQWGKEAPYVTPRSAIRGVTTQNAWRSSSMAHAHQPGYVRLSRFAGTPAARLG